MEPMKPMRPMKPMEGMKPMEPMKTMEPMKFDDPWWPSDLGTPSSSGSQNGARYAYFADAKRLVVDTNGDVKTYDTGEHHIQGFGQQSGGPLRFQSAEGPVDLAHLTTVG